MQAYHSDCSFEPHARLILGLTCQHVWVVWLLTHPNIGFSYTRTGVNLRLMSASGTADVTMGRLEAQVNGEEW